MTSSPAHTLKPCVPSELNPPLKYILVEDALGLQKVREYFQRASVFAIDTETNVTDNPFLRRCRTIQVGDRNEQYVIDLLSFANAAKVTITQSQGSYKPHDCYQPVLDVLRPVLESKTHLKVGHNLQFDYEVLKWTLGLRMWNLYDTMLAEKNIYAGAVNFKMSGFWALDDLVGRYCGLQISKAQQKGFDFSNPLTTEQLEYCALDCRLPMAVKSGQHDKLTKGNLFYAVQIDNDAIPAFADMHLNGMMLDEQLWNTLLDTVRVDHKRHLDKLDTFFIPVVGSKASPTEDLEALELVWKTTKDKALRAECRMKFMAARKQTNTLLKNMDKYEGEAAINYGAPAQILKALRKMGFTASKLKSTDDRSLKISSEHPSWDMKKSKKEDPQLEKVGVIDTVRLYRETGQLLKSYEDWIKDYKNPITGLFHSRIDLLGAATGRSSSSNPNVQNIPKGSDWRSCFVCPEGYVVATLDYSGCELRILAEYSQEKAFLDAFLKDWDVHSVGAEIIFGKKWKDAAEAGCAYYTDHQKCKCKGHKDLRDQIKAINFGIAYGMEAKKLSETVEITEDEAKGLLKIYRAAFPTLIKYLEASGKSATMKYEARTLAQRRRLFHKPLWQEAVAKAILKLKDKGIVGQAPNSKQISSAYKAMYSAIEREGKNTPIQGSNADMAKIAAGCGFDKSGKGFMWHELEPKYGGKLVNFVHDEFVVWLPKAVAEQGQLYIGDAMTRGGAELVKSVPMTYEGHLAPQWNKG